MTKRKYNSKRKSKRKDSSKKTKILRAILLFILLLLIVGFVSFRVWKSQQLAQALSDNQIVNTIMGPIEYKSIGNGPIIILSHMGGSGSDNIELFREIADAGYRIICPSRPGYLNTPLSENANFEYQADLFAELLNQLNISEKVFIMGISAGGPAAIEFASKYPDRCKGLILHSAISKNFAPLSEMKEFSQLINIMLSPIWQDAFSWLNYIGCKLAPTKLTHELFERSSTYDHDKIKEMSIQVIKDEKNKKLLQLFISFTSPLSSRTDGLQNDIKYTEHYSSSKITVPALITHSRVDKIVDFSHAKTIKNKIRIAELYEYDGYGHAFWFGKEWKNINNKMLAFLKKYRSKIIADSDPQVKKLIAETWVNKMNGGLLKMNADGKFTLDFPGVDKKEVINGNFSITDRTLIFLVNNNPNYCKNINGKYSFKIKKNELILSVINDNCLSRKEHFTQDWFKL